MPEYVEIKSIVNAYIVNHDVKAAVSALLQIPVFQDYSKSLDSDALDVMRSRAETYLSIYACQCVFEIVTTWQFATTSTEGGDAAVLARSFIDRGQEIKGLVGSWVAITEQEETLLEDHGHAISIVQSARLSQKGVLLMLGPARFCNHACEPNARLVPKRSRKVVINAIKPIHPRTEITVSYREDKSRYDGCLCSTCRRERPAWEIPCSQDSIVTTPDAPSRMTGEKCRVCHDPLVVADGKFGTCKRCERHLEVFNMNWPHRSWKLEGKRGWVDSG